MQSYSYQSIEQDQKQEYKQELGLRKMLYKYQHENEQLKNQIKALTQRLQSIMNKNNNHDRGTGSFSANLPNSPQNKLQQMHTKYLTEQMSHYFKRIEQVNAEIKSYKEAIDTSKEIQFTQLTNVLKEKEARLEGLRNRVEKFRAGEADGEAGQARNVNNNSNSNSHNNSNSNSNNVDVSGSMNTNCNSNDELQIKYGNELAEIKKRIRELQKTRNNNLKMDINRHMAMVNLETKTRKIANSDLQTITAQQTSSGPGKKGLWGLDLTEQNYKKILVDLEQLKKQKNILLESIKIENAGLRDRLAKLKNEYIDISSNASVMNNSVNLSVSKLKEISLQTPQKGKKEIVHLPDLPVPLGNSAYERKNDKNFVPKKIKLVEWNPNKGKKSLTGFSWNDQPNKSPITGINIWLDKHLIGLQFIHTLGQTIQHIHSEGQTQPKKLVPIQYRLNSNDYLQNIILILSKTPTTTKQQMPTIQIVGLQLYSKNARKDSFGMKVGSQGTEKFDFGIGAPEKPIYSFGSFVINSLTHVSCISSLGFAVI